MKILIPSALGPSALFSKLETDSKQLNALPHQLENRFNTITQNWRCRERYSALTQSKGVN